jgi:hypothetical protein
VLGARKQCSPGPGNGLKGHRKEQKEKKMLVKKKIIQIITNYENLN